ncbi:MAG: glycerophosphodiester phosphodiesterase [Candidatus Omnitrophica bacterium]|nr:glycerophosphodiester phosphodiesterase [Candidatus Omnitrophota bacterium]
MKHNLLVIGHRGAKGVYPENTLGSIQKAIEAGADMVEIDVHACAGGEIVVMHDDRLERTTDGTGYVSRKSLTYLKGLDAGQGEKVPTLREVLDLIERRIAVNIELKGPGTLGPVLHILGEYVSRHGWTYDQFVVSTFARKHLKRLAKHHPKVRIGALLAYRPWGFIPFARAIRAYSVHLNLRVTSPRLIREAREAQLKVFVWTVNDPIDIDRMRAWGVDGIFTDFPARTS